MIPDSRIPFIYVDFDNSKAIQPGGRQAYSVLLVGEKLEGQPHSLVPIRITSAKNAAEHFGAGSELHKMSEAYFKNNSATKTYAVALEKKEETAELIQAISDRQFHLIVNSFNDPKSLSDWHEDLTSRFSAARQIEGHLFSGFSGKEEQLSSTTPASKHLTYLALPSESNVPDAVYAAAVAGAVAESAEEDPARPFNTLPLYGCNQDLSVEGFGRAARSRLLNLGFSTINFDDSGVPRIERLITTYKNPANESDESYLSINTLLTLSYLRFSFRSYFASKYPRHKLADDTAIVRPGSAILTPKVAQCEAIALFRQWEEDGLVENFEEFKSELIVERNKKDRGRLDFFMSPRLVSQLNVIGANVSFLI